MEMIDYLELFLWINGCRIQKQVGKEIEILCLLHIKCRDYFQNSQYPEYKVNNKSGRITQ